MRIVVVNPSWNTYSEAWLQRMMAYFSDQIVGVACFAPEQDKWVNGAPSFNLYGNKPSAFERFFYHFFKRNLIKRNPGKDFIKFITKCKPDILFINFIGPALQLKKSLHELNIPITIHVHGIDISWEANDDATGAGLYPDRYRNDIKELSKSVQKFSFIANSEFSERQLKQVFPAGVNIFLKYFGMPEYSTGKTFRQRELSIFFIGRFVDFKGPELVVEAFIKACDEGFEGTLTMVGNGYLKPMCMLLARRSRYSLRIIFKEPATQEEVFDYLKDADIFTMHNCPGTISNREEAFGVTLIEAMAYGVPVITGASGGPIEIVQNGYNGILVEPFNVQQHAEAFMYFQDNSDKLYEMSLNCKKSIADKFSDIKEREALIRIFESTINGS